MTSGEIGHSELAEGGNSCLVIGSGRLARIAKKSDLVSLSLNGYRGLPWIGLVTFYFVYALETRSRSPLSIGLVLTCCTWPEILIPIIRSYVIGVIYTFAILAYDMAVHGYYSFLSIVQGYIAHRIKTAARLDVMGKPIEPRDICVAVRGDNSNLSLRERYSPARLAVYIKDSVRHFGSFIADSTIVALSGYNRFHFPAFTSVIDMRSLYFLCCCKISTRLGNQLLLVHDRPPKSIVRVRPHSQILTCSALSFELVEAGPA